MTIRNNKLAAIAAILTTALTLASCELETSDNGKFDGFWHLERVDTLATGGSLNLQQKRIFWGSAGEAHQRTRHRQGPEPRLLSPLPTDHGQHHHPHAL